MRCGGAGGRPSGSVMSRPWITSWLSAPAAAARWLPGVADVVAQRGEQFVGGHPGAVAAGGGVGEAVEGEPGGGQARREARRAGAEGHREVGDDLADPPAGAEGRGVPLLLGEVGKECGESLAFGVGLRWSSVLPRCFLFSGFVGRTWPSLLLRGGDRELIGS